MTALSDLLRSLSAQRAISSEDVPAVRRLVYQDGAIQPTEAELMIAADEVADTSDEGWRTLFHEALTDFLVRQQSPVGYIDQANADWLCARIAKDGKVKTGTELELLVRILETAESAPQSLVEFALAQVRTAVLDGEGPLAQLGGCEKGRVSKGEVELLRRILFAAGGADGIAITREEAELLFDINAASQNADNDASWPDFFARAVAASVMAASGYRAPSRDEAARRELWLSQGPDVGGFAARMLAAPDFAGAAKSVFGRKRTSDAAQAEAMERRNRQAELVNAPEAEWLAARIDHDGVLDHCEQTLLAFLRRESPSIHPALRPLLERAAA